MTDSASVTLVEPTLSVSRAVTAPGSTADAGDTFSFTTTIVHTAASDAPAFSLSLTEDMGSLLEVDDGSLACVPNVCSQQSASGSTLVVSISSLDVGETVAVSYTATVAQGITPADVLRDDGDSSLLFFSAEEFT